MRFKYWPCLLLAGLLAVFGPAAFGQGHSDEHGHGKGHEKHERDDDDGGHDFYRDHDRHSMREWYEDHYDHLPPGLAKRDRLPPGLERQLMVRGTLPPGLQKRIHPCPEELVRTLPPPPPNCEHVLLGGHIVLLNRTNFQVVDIFHLEL